MLPLMLFHCLLLIRLTRDLLLAVEDCQLHRVLELLLLPRFVLQNKLSSSLTLTLSLCYSSSAR